MLDLDMIANDLAEVLSGEHGIDVGAADVRHALVPFIEALAPRELTAEQRFGFDTVEANEADRKVRLEQRRAAERVFRFLTLFEADTKRVRELVHVTGDPRTGQLVELTRADLHTLCGAVDSPPSREDMPGIPPEKCNPSTGFHSTPHRGCILRGAQS